MTITAGGREQILSTTLLLGDTEQGTVSFEIEGWKAKLNISFHPPLHPGERLRVDWEHRGERLWVNFRGWDQNTLGTVVSPPADFGLTPSGRTLYFSAFHQRVGSVNRLDLQVLVGGANE